MKKVNLTLNIVLLLAVAVLYVLHFTGNKTDNTVSSEDSRITAGSGDIVYINLDTLVNQYDMYEELRGQNAERAPDVLSGREHEK